MTQSVSEGRNVTVSLNKRLSEYLRQVCPDRCVWVSNSECVVGEGSMPGDDAPNVKRQKCYIHH